MSYQAATGGLNLKKLTSMLDSHSSLQPTDDEHLLAPQLNFGFT